MVQVGDEQIYRLRDFASSQRVRVVSIEVMKKSAKYEIEFLDGDSAGKREKVPGKRLRGPWSGVREYDEAMATWERFAAFELSDPEEAAVETVFSELIPEAVARWEWSEPVRRVTTISDAAGLEPLIGIPASDLIAQVDSFASGEDTVVSPEGTLMIAEYACRVNPMPILNGVIEEECKCREKTKRGEAYTSHDGQQRTSDPEWEYRWYLEHDRPRHELLRGWCGHRAVTTQERLAAAEAEVQRLDVLIARLVDQMKGHDHSMFAEVIERVHEEERITAANYRPVVDRPLKPSEIPVRYECAPRRWWYRHW